MVSAKCRMHCRIWLNILQFPGACRCAVCVTVIPNDKHVRSLQFAQRHNTSPIKKSILYLLHWCRMIITLIAFPDIAGLPSDTSLFHDGVHPAGYGSMDKTKRKGRESAQTTALQARERKVVEPKLDGKFFRPGGGMWWRIRRKTFRSGRVGKPWRGSAYFKNCRSVERSTVQNDLEAPGYVYERTSAESALHPWRFYVTSSSGMQTKNTGVHALKNRGQTVAGGVEHGFFNL
jgi:hypothetical protein